MNAFAKRPITFPPQRLTQGRFRIETILLARAMAASMKRDGVGNAALMRRVAWAKLAEAQAWKRGLDIVSPV